MGCCASNEPRATGSTPSHGNPASTSALNTELNNVARNTDDTAKARALVARGADLASTNGPHWRHTPLHQAAYHGRYKMAKTLVELGAPLHLHSNPCGRGATGIPLELARGGGHTKIAEMLEKAMKGERSNRGGSRGVARHEMDRAGGGSVKSHDMAGCWLLCGFPLFWEIARKGPVGDHPSRYWEKGCAFLFMGIPFPVDETWTRDGDTNNFRKDKNPGDVVNFSSGSCGNEKGFICKCKICP